MVLTEVLQVRATLSPIPATLRRIQTGVWKRPGYHATKESHAPRQDFARRLAARARRCAKRSGAPFHRQELQPAGWRNREAVPKLELHRRRGLRSRTSVSV